MSKTAVWHLVKNTVREWQEDNALRLGAALSYYTIFSLAPLLIIVIAIAGLVFGNEAAQSQILDQMEGLMGSSGASAVAQMIENAQKPATGIIASILGIITLLLGATGVVGQLKEALNTIWDVKEDKGGIFQMVKDRIASAGMILAIGFLLLVSLALSAGLTAVTSYWGEAALLEVLNFVLSIVVVSGLFALIFKVLPDIEIQWRNVFVGAFVTAILFTVGKTLTALYIAKSSVASAYGAAGSLVIILVWVYYNSQILFLGAEFTQVYSRKKDREKEGQKEIPMNEEQTPETPLQEDQSLIYKAAYYTGAKTARIQKTGKEVQKKVRLAKWGYRIVHFLGIKRSAKLGWKGYKAKQKVDELLHNDKEDKEKETQRTAS